MFVDLHRRTLEEFRGYHEPDPQREPVLAASVVMDVMRELGLGERIHEEAVQAEWASIVGEFLARHSTPETLRKGILAVRVLQPTVHYELDRVWKMKILAGLQERFGRDTIREIRFRV